MSQPPASAALPAVRSGAPARSLPDFAIFAAVVALSAGAVAFLVHAEDQRVILAALLGLGLAWAAAARLRVIAAVERGSAAHPWPARMVMAGACAAVLVVLRQDNFGLLMLATVLIYATTCLGLTIQLGYAGLSNFAAAAFVGCGGYTAAAFGRIEGLALPDAAVILLGGVTAVAVGSALILPVLRTRGHYAALTTLAFGVMFNVFLDANELLGGPQGLKLAPINLFGWDFSQDPVLFGVEFSFYANYALLCLALTAGALVLAGLLDRSWMGIRLDAVRLDEVAAQVFGLRVARWKILAFTLGNALAGMAGAVYAKMTGFIAPNNFTLGDSLMMVSIVILGGIGNRWGVLPAALIVVLLPEKLQFIQEYRLLLFAVLVILVLVLSPGGLLPRRTRTLAGGAA
ncbi:MAG: branched-chain amino acid ABC transporter permease [Methylobacterium frigidaeris]